MRIVMIALCSPVLLAACSSNDGSGHGDGSGQITQGLVAGTGPAAQACGTRFVATAGDDQPGGAPNDCTSAHLPCRTIQRAVDAARPGDTVRVASGVYAENVVVTKALTIAGRGDDTVIVPAVSSPDPCNDSSLCGGAASNVVLVRASDVTLRDLAIDGDNPELTSGVVRGGADVDARNGVVTDYASGTFDDLAVERVVVKNVFWRGLYAASGGTFRFEHDVVTNVQGDVEAIAVFDFGGAGRIADTRVEDATAGIAANHSRGVTFAGDLVLRSGAGLHTDNAGDTPGATADRIERNVVRDCTAGGYGVFVFVPYTAPTIDDNLVQGCDVGLAAFGAATGAATVFEHNRVEGDAGGESIGAQITTDQLGFGAANVAVRLVGNELTRTGIGVLVTQTGGFVADVSLECNRIEDDDVGVLTSSASGELRDNVIAGNGLGVDATRVTSGTVDARENYWGCFSGVGGSGCDTVAGPVDTSNPDRTAPRCARSCRRH